MQDNINQTTSTTNEQSLDAINLPIAAVMLHFRVPLFNLQENINNLLDGIDQHLNEQMLYQVDPCLAKMVEIRSDLTLWQDIMLYYYQAPFNDAMLEMQGWSTEKINSKVGRAVVRKQIDSFIDEQKIIDFGFAAIIKSAVSDKRSFKVTPVDDEGVDLYIKLDERTLQTWVDTLINGQCQFVLSQVHRHAMNRLSHVDQLAIGE